MNFLSPYVIIDGAMNGIVNGSLIMFGLMFVSSLFLGRAWCGWVCPGGGMQEIVEPINNKPGKWPKNRLDQVGDLDPLDQPDRLVRMSEPVGFQS